MTSIWNNIHQWVRAVICTRSWYERPELQKRANQLVLFFLAGANFWEKHAKNRRKHAKTGEKQRFFGANLFCGKNWSVLIFTPFATMDDDDDLQDEDDE